MQNHKGGKILGITLGGFAGYLVLSKGLDVIKTSVKSMCEACKWKAYYKYAGGNDNAVPPGYSVEKTGYSDGKTEHAKRPLNSSLSPESKSAIESLFNREKAPEGPLEAQIEASESDICPDAEKEEDLASNEVKNDDILEGEANG